MDPMSGAGGGEFGGGSSGSPSDGVDGSGARADGSRCPPWTRLLKKPHDL